MRLMQNALANRLRKRQKHLRKWAWRSNVTCYRLYDRDIPEYPLIVDWYNGGAHDGEAVVWLYDRTRDETDEEAEAWRDQAFAEIKEGLALADEQIFVKAREIQRGNAQYERLNQTGVMRVVAEQGLRFEVNLSDYLDTGLFLDHRTTRAMVRELAADRRVLNLFAYTGSFTCYAIAGGARATCTVDLSKTYCDWTLRNFRHNGFEQGEQHNVIQADCLAFLKEEITRGVGYDLIVCDPPTFSNSKRMEAGSFDVARDQADLIADCAALLNDGGALFFSTNARGFKLDEKPLPNKLSVTQLTPQTIPEDFRNKRIHQCWRLQAP